MKPFKPVRAVFSIVICLSIVTLYHPSYPYGYKDGVYIGVADGYSGKLTVEVTVKNGRITSVKVLEHSEFEKIEAIEDMPDRIIEAQSTQGVDAVSGASYTSAAILKAVDLALAQSFGENTTPPSDGPKVSLGARTWLPTPVWVIGSYDKEGKPNMMTAAWVGICCSRPPCVTVSLREATYTYGNIMERKAFTVNVPPESYASVASYFGSVSGRDEDKLAGSGLTAVVADSVDAPYLAEFPLVVECRVIHTHRVGLHTMFIGEIKDVKADPSILDEEGRPDVAKLHPFIFAPMRRGFYRSGDFFGTVSELRATMNH